MVGGARQHESGRRDQPERDRHQAGLDGDAPPRLLEAVPEARDEKCHQTGRPAHADGRERRAGQSGDVIADQRDDDDVGARRDLRDGEIVGELTVGHPVHDVDGDAVHLRDRRIGAADRKQRQQREMIQTAQAADCRSSPHPDKGQRHADRRQHGKHLRQRPLDQATAMKPAIATGGAKFHRLRNSGSAIFTTLAMISPAAAEAMPPRMRVSTARSPKCA